MLDCSIKLLGDFIRYFLSPELGWNLLPGIEDHKIGLVTIIANCLTTWINKTELEHIAFPILLRSCENFGRFLILR